MIILIGSMALGYHSIYDFRNPMDIDIISPFREGKEFVKNTFGNIRGKPINNGKSWVYRQNSRLIIENRIIWEDSEALLSLSDYVKNDPETIIEDGYHIPSLNVLYALKMSHRFLKDSPFFDKTMFDIHFLREKGCFIPEDFKEVYSKLEKDHYNYSHPNLNQLKNEFFDDSVPYKYDHDSIHEAVKTIDKPAYQYFKPEGNEVFCSKNMFFECDEYIRLLAVLEESYVLALERAIVPYNITSDDRIKNRFEYALMKVCTSITSGWFRDFAWENHSKVLSMYDEKFYTRFLDGIKNGIVRNYKK